MVSIDSVVDTSTIRQASTPSVKGEVLKANMVAETAKNAKRPMSMSSAWKPGLGVVDEVLLVGGGPCLLVARQLARLECCASWRRKWEWFMSGFPVLDPNRNGGMPLNHSPYV